MIRRFELSSIFRSRAGIVMIVGFLVMCAAGILAEVSAQEIQKGYGRQRGKRFGDSVNGTSALIELFRIKGRKVSTWTKLSPRINDYQTIFWFPDKFDPPSQSEIDRLNQWMDDGYNRTLVYVGRDYDAEIDYWQRVMPTAADADKMQMRRRLAEAKADYSTRLRQSDPQATCEWFQLDRTQSARRITTPTGEWLDNTTARNFDLYLNTRLIPAANDVHEYHTITSRQLLMDGNESLATEVVDEYYGQQKHIIFITNGSFLLNLPLVDPANRELAGQLMDEVDNYGDVLFLESGPEGIPIRQSEDSNQTRRATEWMMIWPLNLIIFHAMVIGIVFLFAYQPIFGRPKQVLDDSTRDFGKHIESLGQLVRSTGDEEYALSRLQHYQQHVKGQSHGKQQSHGRQHGNVQSTAQPHGNTENKSTVKG